MIELATVSRDIRRKQKTEPEATETALPLLRERG
jgi:hypothetical protein